MLLGKDRDKASKLIRDYENRRTRGICKVFKHFYPNQKLSQDTISSDCSLSIVANHKRLTFIIGTALDAYNRFEGIQPIEHDSLQTSLIMISNTNGTCTLSSPTDYMKALTSFQIDCVSHAQEAWLEEKARLYQKMILPVPTNGASIEKTIRGRFNRERLNKNLTGVLEAELELYDHISSKHPEYKEINRMLKYVTERLHPSEVNYFFPSKESKSKSA